MGKVLQEQFDIIKAYGFNVFEAEYEGEEPGYQEEGVRERLTLKGSDVGPLCQIAKNEGINTILFMPVFDDKKRYQITEADKKVLLGQNFKEYTFLDEEIENYNRKTEKINFDVPASYDFYFLVGKMQFVQHIKAREYIEDKYKAMQGWREIYSEQFKEISEKNKADK